MSDIFGSGHGPKVFKSCPEKSLLTSFSQKAKSYLRTNWGSPFIIAFMVLLTVSALELSADAGEAANGIAIYAFYSLVLGVLLQLASYVKYGESGSTADPTASQRTAIPPSARLSRRTRLAAGVIVVVILAGGLVLAYPTLIAPSPASSQSSQSEQSPIVSGCSGTGSDGSVFVSATAAVSIEICGRSYSLAAGTGGGLTYSYSSGKATLVAPPSANGSQFEFWYAIVGGSPPVKVSSTTLVLDIPAGLSAQTSLVELFYAAPATLATSTTKSASSSSSASSVSTSSATSSSYSSSSASSTNSSSTVAQGCRGSDGTFFVSTNVHETVSVDVCAEQVEVPGGVGGGLVFSYRTGNVTLTAPQLTPGGKTFEYWYLILPSGAEKITTARVSVDFPPGYGSGNALIEAYYA